MPKQSARRKATVTKEIDVPVRIEQNTMYLRTDMCEARTTVEGIEYKVDMCGNIDGSCVIVGVSTEGTSGWTNYVFTSESLIRAVLDLHLVGV